MFLNKGHYEEMIDKIINGELNEENVKKNDRVAKKLIDLNRHFSLNKDDVKKLMNYAISIAVDISKFDVNLRHQSSRVVDSTNNINEISQVIYSTFEEITASMDVVEKNSGEFVDSMNNISHKANDIKKGVIDNNETLEYIEQDIVEVKSITEKMSNNVGELIDVADKVNKALESINGIAEQINMLALNASIEAARAGEHGRGFNVVAEEIRKLSIDTKELVGSLGGLVDKINIASSHSSESVSKSVEGISKINERIEHIGKSFDETENFVKKIDDDINSVNAFSQELSASIEQVSAAMEETVTTTEKMNKVVENLSDVSLEIENIAENMDKLEKKVSRSAKISGEIGSTEMCRFTNDEFINAVKPSIQAHRKWVNVLRDMVDYMDVRPLQTDSHKCSFGHFYHSVEPKHPEIIKPWREIDEYHDTLHNLGHEVIENIQANNKKAAQENLEQAVEISENIISIFEDLVDTAGKLKERGEMVF
ncbi:methyl-accepting chemotaxis protein [Clostridiisalibacter paucivorans]|uniref:methyl-accepting chemotaxis protein n=1 Tax=Clostridiisalibacter paucivorans TaxID=408753 RepID=UPI00047E1E01|nr:methyl-accepting chemotaxis protein [Clostridiisalibacter paucivorans]